MNWINWKGQNSYKQPWHPLSCYHNSTPTGKFTFAPSVEEVMLAFEDLEKILKPLQQAGKKYKDPELHLVFRVWLEGRRQFMWTYINPNSGLTDHWTALSVHTADCLQRGLCMLQVFKTRSEPSLQIGRSPG